MKKPTLFFQLFWIMFSFFVFNVQAIETKKKIVVKKFTQYDFTGQTVQGAVRAPEVFYIFQRKRSEGHQVVDPPRTLSHHRTQSLSTFEGGLPK